SPVRDGYLLLNSTHLTLESTVLHYRRSALDSPGLGLVFSLCHFCTAFRIHRSPVGQMSGRRRQNIRNTCAVHRPMPFTWVSSAMTSCSGIDGKRGNSTNPAWVFAARS